MKVLILIGMMGLAMCVTGCAVSTADIDVSKKDPICARGCSNSFSTCIGSAFGHPALLSCREGLKLCVQTCPSK
jgi:hypothetical protein